VRWSRVRFRCDREVAARMGFPVIDRAELNIGKLLLLMEAQWKNDHPQNQPATTNHHEA
jgi:hypothetical protein